MPNFDQYYWLDDKLKKSEPHEVILSQRESVEFLVQFFVELTHRDSLNGGETQNVLLCAQSVWEFWLPFSTAILMKCTDPCALYAVICPNWTQNWMHQLQKRRELKNCQGDGRSKLDLLNWKKLFEFVKSNHQWYFDQILMVISSSLCSLLYCRELV